MEHSVITVDQMDILIKLIQKNGKKAYVRVGKNDELLIKQSLDSGADGIIVPMINTELEAKKAIESTFYKPIGNRGVGLSSAQKYGYELDKYISKKSKKNDLIVQIESVEAIKNLKKFFH